MEDAQRDRPFILESANALVIIEEREGELVLRPAAAVPMRDLPSHVIEDWIQEDEAGMRELTALDQSP